MQDWIFMDIQYIYEFLCVYLTFAEA
jgi:hypothetical protein